MKIHHILAGLFIVLTPSLVHADIEFEPYVGYSFFGSGDSAYGATPYKHKLSGLGYGGRLGYKMSMFSLGIDYSMQNNSLRTETSTSSVTVDKVKRNNLGLYAKLFLTTNLSLWGTYYLSATMKGEEPASSSTFIDTTEEFSDGTGYSIGLGLKQFQYLSLNLEYRSLKYGKDKINATAVSNYTKKLNISEVFLSVSFPIYL